MKSLHVAKILVFLGLIIIFIKGIHYTFVLDDVFSREMTDPDWRFAIFIILFMIFNISATIWSLCYMDKKIKLASKLLIVVGVFNLILPGILLLSSGILALNYKVAVKNRENEKADSDGDIEGDDVLQVWQTPEQLCKRVYYLVGGMAILVCVPIIYMFAAFMTYYNGYIGPTAIIISGILWLFVEFILFFISLLGALYIKYYPKVSIVFFVITIILSTASMMRIGEMIHGVLSFFEFIMFIPLLINAILAILAIVTASTALSLRRAKAQEDKQ